MMSLFSIFAVSFTIALSGALMPGPLLATVMSESPRSGSKTGLLIATGHALLEMAMVAIIVVGLARYLQHDIVLRTIAIVGGLVLVYFGGDMVRKLPTTQVPESVVALPSKRRLIATGITVSAINPYFTLWWLTIGLGLVVAANRQGPVALGVFFLGHILADFGWYFVVALAVSRGKKVLLRRGYKTIVAFCGVSLIVFGILFAGTAFRTGQLLPR